jgi:hypothetical protein
LKVHNALNNIAIDEKPATDTGVAAPGGPSMNN